MKIKELRKVTALGTAVVMLAGTLAGCGNSEDVENSPTSAESKQQTVASEAVESSEFSYPMEGGKKLTLTTRLRPEVEAAGFENYGELKYGKAATEATGIEIEYTHLSNASFNQEFNYFVAAGEYTDIIECSEGNYTGGLKALYDDGVIIALNDVIDQYMPNFKAWMEANPTVAGNVYSADGNIYGLPYVYETPEQTYTVGLFLRQDWLEELKLNVPTTIKEWHDVLVAFRDAKGVVPYTCWGGYVLNSNGIGLAYTPGDLTNRMVIDPETGKVAYTRMLDSYREYLATMHDWREEGLLDPDALSLDEATCKAKLASGEAGASWGWQHHMDYTDIPFVAAPIPMKEKGIENYKSLPAQVSTHFGCISTQCDDVETAARYLDYFYSEEGMLLANFGIEGESYEMVDGKPQYTELITNNPEGLSMMSAKANYVRIGAFPGIVSYQQSQLGLATEQARESYGIWSQGTDEFALSPKVKPADDKVARVKEINSELNTYYSEMSAKFYLGTADIHDDAVWNEYVETMKTMGVDELIEIYQDAYDAYQANKK